MVYIIHLKCKLYFRLLSDNYNKNILVYILYITCSKLIKAIYFKIIEMSFLIFESVNYFKSNKITFLFKFVIHNY